MQPLTQTPAGVDGLLEHLPSRGSLYYKRPALHALQKIILDFGGSPLLYSYNGILIPGEAGRGGDAEHIPLPVLGQLHGRLMDILHGQYSEQGVSW